MKEKVCVCVCVWRVDVWMCVSNSFVSPFSPSLLPSFLPSFIHSFLHSFFPSFPSCPPFFYHAHSVHTVHVHMVYTVHVHMVYMVHIIGVQGISYLAKHAEVIGGKGPKDASDR